MDVMVPSGESNSPRASIIQFCPVYSKVVSNLYCTGLVTNKCIGFLSHVDSQWILCKEYFLAAFSSFPFESGVEQSKYAQSLVNRMPKFMTIKLDIPLCCIVYLIFITERPITLTNVGNKKTTTIICNIEIVDFAFAFYKNCTPAL